MRAQSERVQKTERGEEGKLLLDEHIRQLIVRNCISRQVLVGERNLLRHANQVSLLLFLIAQSTQKKATPTPSEVFFFRHLRCVLLAKEAEKHSFALTMRKT
jgi:hypothetical protein